MVSASGHLGFHPGPAHRVHAHRGADFFRRFSMEDFRWNFPKVFFGVPEGG